MILNITLLALAAAGGAEFADDLGSSEIVITGRREEEEGGSYKVETTRSATRLPLSQRETPQSISVVTSAQIEDFALTDVNALLSTTTGINVQQTETDRTYYSARGFDITNFQLDGVGLPFAYGLQNGALDTVTYSRVEVLRGANGLTSLTGNPSATINFVRKRPFDSVAAQVLARYGSFDEVRLEGDVSVPIAPGFRARAVAAWQDTQSYLDRYQGERLVLYAIAEADIGPATQLAVGFQRSENRTRGGLWGALPLYFTDGTPTDYPRSTSTSADWAVWDIEDQQIFGDLTHAFDNGWTAKLSVLRRGIDEDERLFYVYGTPDRATGDGLFAYPGAFRGPTRETTVDAYISGPVSLFGRAHDVVLGVNRGEAELRQFSSYPPAGAPLPGNSAFDGSVALPDFPPFALSADFETRRDSAYGLVRINPSDAFKLMLGGSIVDARSDGVSYGVRRDYAHVRALPFAGATLELTTSLSAYASYTKIFNPQIELDEQFRLLPPITGDNIEAGLKGSWLGGKLYASASVFRARQNNTAESAGFDVGTGQTLYRTVDGTSEGVEFDLGGEPLPGLQATGGLTFLRIEGDEGEAVRTYVPRRTGRLNLSYTPPSFPAFTAGAAVQYQSRIRRTQPLLLPSGEAVVTEQDAYALVDLMARYAITPDVSVTANVRNLTNVKYITSLYWEQGFYGAPRTASVTLGVSF